METSVKKVGSGELGTVRQSGQVPNQTGLTAAQQELLSDMRESLKQMRRGETLPAREALREIHLELKAEDDASSSDN